MLGVGGVLAEALGRRRVPARAARPSVDADELIDDLATQTLLGAVPRRAARSTATRCAAVLARPVAARAEARPDVVSVDVNPLIVVDGRPVAVDALVELGDRVTGRRHAGRHADAEQFRALFEPRGVVVAGASTPSRQVRVRRAAQHPRRGLRRARSCATNLEGDAGARHRHRARHRRPARRAVATSCSCARRRRANPDLLRACAEQGHPRRVRHSRRATARRATRAGSAEHELVALADELGILLAGPERPGRRVDAGARCARRSSRPYPPAGPHRRSPASRATSCRRSMNYAVQTGVGVSRAVSAGNAAAVSVADYLDCYADDPTTAVEPRLRRGHRRRPRASSSGSRARRRAQAARAREGRRDRGRRSGRRRATPGALAADDRVFDGHVPPGRRHARGDDRGGVRGGGDVRHPAAARRARTSSCSRPPAAGASSPPTRSRATRDLELAAAARRPARRDRREAAAALEPQQPGRPAPAARRATRSPRCWSWSPRTPTSTRSCTSASASSRTRRALMRDGPLLPRPRPRAHRRLPRAPGRPLRGGRRRDLRRDRQADPHRHRAGGRRSRQPRAGDRPRHRPALLPVGEPRRDRARPPVALRPVPPSSIR